MPPELAEFVAAPQGGLQADEEVDRDIRNQHGIAARAHWLTIGARFQVLGRTSAEDFADAPLRQTLSRLCATAAKPDAVAADAAADGLMIDGLLHYYSGDYPTGIARLSAFTAGYPAHRWHDEGVRFLGIVQRLQQKSGGK